MGTRIHGFHGLLIKTHEVKYNTNIKSIKKHKDKIINTSWALEYIFFSISL